MGMRVIKTALAAIVAIYAADFFSLDFPLSAGLLAVLGVDVTKKRGIQSALKRFIASVLGLLLAVFVFYLLDFQFWAIGIFICIAYPILAKVKLQDGIVTSSVIVLHVYDQGSITLPIIMNEIWLLFIGLGAATMFNLLYMPKADKQLLQKRMEVEQLFSEIFIKLANHLKDNTYIWDGKEIIAVVKAIESGNHLSIQANENALFRGDTSYWTIYFHMREQQLESIQRMMDIVAQIYLTVPHGQITAEVFMGLSEDVKNDYYTGHVEGDLLALEEKFREMPLPLSREEFEIRSAILQLCVELKHYLMIAKKEKKQKEQI